MTDTFDYIEPYRQFYGCVVPNWLMEQRAVGPVAKLVYGELAWRSAKQAGIARVTLAELTDRVGGTKSTVQRALKELEGLRLIETRQLGLNLANEYRFLDHPWIRRRPEATVGNRGGQNDHTAMDPEPRSGQYDHSGVVNMTTPSSYLQELSNSGSPPTPPTPAEGPEFDLGAARGLVEEWWARQNPAPRGVGRATLARRVLDLVRAGWPESLVGDALDQCENFTLAAIEGRLRGLRSTGTDRHPQAALGAAGVALVAKFNRPDCDECGPHSPGMVYDEELDAARRCTTCNPVG